MSVKNKIQIKKYKRYVYLYLYTTQDVRGGQMNFKK